MSPYYFRHNLSDGVLEITVPKRVSEFDVEMMQAHFDLIVKQAKRRAFAEPELDKAMEIP